MTERLYYKDVHINESISQITEKLEKDGKKLVVLDRSPFYPEGGGQPSDTGKIDEAVVTYVFEEGSKVYHVVDNFPQKDEVKCEIDLERRFDHMQQHSGEHLVASSFFKLLGAVSQGFHMGEDYVNIDINLPEISQEAVSKVEDKVNSYIYENIPVETFFVTPEESKKIELRKRVEGEEEIRIVKIGEADACACCGTHVKYTGEIGIVKITKTEKYKGMTRVYFKCGQRAFDDYRAKQEIIAALVKSLSTGESDILSKVLNDAENAKNLGRKLSEYKRKLSAYEVNNLKAKSVDKVVHFIYEDKEMDELQMIAEQLSSEDIFAAIGSTLQGQLIVIAGGGHEVNVGQFFKEKVKSFNGKGGGSAVRAQAVFPEKKDMEGFMDELLKLF